ncbi:tape measure protein [Phocaeicola plebeius]|uniref:Tape measure protein n=1 Tax=Phocaeicola plebeius TaxID=310297 RepID=A0A921L4K6_9BACT|nr:tape measure protein [Phocaeicola plebeius]HJF80304.1 tape measure protein [Phocaeicola plebeius]
MPTLVFKIAADYEAVIRLREEISKLEAQLKKMDVNKAPAAARALETQLAATRQQMMGLVTEAAKAGAVIENGFKKKIYDASQTVNGLSEKIIAQRAVIKDIEFDVKRLGDAYRTALKNNPIGASGKLAEYNAARKALDEEKAALFGLTQQQAEARLSVKKLRDEYSLYKKEAGDTVEINNGLSLSWGKMLGVIGGAAALKSLASQIVRVRGEFQSMQTAIETMVGKDVASGLMAQLKEMAKISPLTLTDMVNAEKMMLGFNIQAEDTVRYLQALSDISMGDSVKFKSLTLAFSQMSAAGKLMGQDLNQMINAGFNPLQIIAEKTGKSISTLKDEMSKGAVSAEMVQQAFIDATSAGGKFYQMSENASKTINGQLSMMQDALDNAFNEMGQASEGVIMEGIKLTTTLIQNYETVGKVLVGLVATYGAYRTAVMLATIATSKHTIAEVALTNARIIARKAQLLLNAAMLTNPYVAVATVITGLVATMWALSDSTTAAEKAQERFCQKSSEMKNKEEERKKSLESLISTINDETTATVARADALNKLKSEYPDIFKKYVDEKGHITDLIELWKEYNDQASVSSRESKQRMVENIDAQIAVTQNNLNTAKANSDWGSVKKYREQLESLQKERAKWVKEVLTDVNRELSVKEEAPKTYAEDYEQARKDWEEAKKELEKIEAEKDKFTSEQYEKAKKRVETTEKAYKNLGGVTSDKPIKDAQKEAERQKEEQQQLAEELLQLRRTNQQEEINLMDEGSEKKRRQIELDYQKEIDAYNKAKAKYGETDEIKAMKLNAETKRSSGLAAINEEEQKKEQERIKAQEDAWNEALIKFGDYNQKRKAIIEKYDKEIAQAQNAGDEWAKTEEKKAALEELDEQYGKSTRVMADLFEDAGEKSVTAIQKIIDKYETLVKYLSGTEQSDGTPVTLDELKAIGFTDKDIESIERGEISIRDLTDALKNLNGELEGKSPWMSFVNDMQKSIGKIKSAKGDSEKIGEGVMGIGNAVTDFAPALGEFAENIGSIFGVDGEKIQGIVGSIQGLGQTATGVGQILSGDIVGGAMSAVGGISKVVSSLEGLFGADYSEYENMKAQYDTLISVWDTLIGKKTEYIDIDYGIEAQKAAEEAIRLTETQIERQRQLANMLAGSGASAGSHSLGYRVNDRMNSQDWQRLSGIVGQDVGSLGDVLALDADVIGNVLQDERFVSVLTEVNSEFIDYISNIGEYAEQLEEIAEKEKEALTGVGLDDFRNGYTDLLADLDSDNQDFADDFEKYLQNAIFSSLVANKYKERIEKLYNQWADYTDSGGKLTGDEADRLRNEYQNIVDDMLAEREQIMKEFGWNSSSSGQQSASSRGFGTEMTHEDAGELSGRFTAVYESNLRIETAEQQQTVAITELRGSIGPLTSQVTGLYNIADETRTILANSYLELQQIRENTEDSAKYLKDIKADISEVKRNTSRL